MPETWESEYLKKVYKRETSQPQDVPMLAPSKAEGLAPSPEQKKRRSPALLVSVLILIISFSAFLGFTLAIFSRFMLFEALLTLMPGEKLLSETNILVLGLDSGQEIHRSDTMIVIHVDPMKNTANAISIPRDTMVEIPGRSQDKINHAYAYGGADLSRQTAEKFLDIKIPYYISIDMRGLESLIDQLGGVTLDVEKRMYYVDHAQNLFVDLYPGMQKLNGNQALSYLRYRHDGGDLSRILRQQKFMQALAGQITSQGNLVHSPQLLLSLFSLMDTNLNTKDIIGLALCMRRIYDFGQIKVETITGSDAMVDGVYYMKPDLAAVQKLVLQYLKGS